MTEAKMTTYVVQFDSSKVDPKNEFVRMTVPSAWKVTYAPTSQKGAYASNGDLCLRFWESDSKQRGLFHHVVSFRAMSIKLERGVFRGSDEDAQGGTLGTGIRLTSKKDFVWEPME